MSEASKSARRANIAKARRLTGGGDARKVDASDWEPSSPPMKADKKTGMRPVSPRTYKHGGKVQGDRGPKRADKAKRGNVADEISTRDTKEANREKFGAPHIGGMKKGGAAEKCGGGAMKTGGRAKRADGGATEKTDKDYENDIKAFNDKTEARMRKSLTRTPSAFTGLRKDNPLLKPKKDGGSVAGGERPVGDRIPRQSGGRAKGKTNINIIVNPNKPGDDQPMTAPARPPMLPMPMPPPGPPPGAAMPPPSMGAGAPPPGMPPMRARGGRLGMNKIGGAGGGLGRLEKANLR